MTITREESDLIERRETMVPELTNIIDRTISELHESIKEAGLKFVGDDRCARVEAALIRFVLECHRGTYHHA